MIRGRPFQNAVWIIVCKVLQSLLQLVVGMLSARYLGPSGYGLISYAASVTAFAIPLMQLGLHLTLVREYVSNPQDAETILGTALGLNALSALLCMMGVTAFASVANRGEPDTVAVCVLYSAGLLFQSMENLQYLFQAKLLSKYASLAMLCSYGAVSAYKLYLLAMGKSVYWFALSHAVEYGTAGILMLLACRRLGVGKLRFSAAAAKKLLSTSRHYIPAALLTALINSAAGILLKLLAGQRENGYYTAALTGSVVLQFVYAAVIDSARPGILEAAKTDRNRYERSFAALYGGLVYPALLQCAAFTVLAEQIIRVLYGTAFLAAVPVLRILIWQMPFALVGWGRDLWLLAEEKHRYLWRVNLWGAAVNVVCNLWLIPQWGACGAAMAAVAGQLISSLLPGFIWKELRPNNRLLLAGLHPAFAWNALKELVKNNEDRYVGSWKHER